MSIVDYYYNRYIALQDKVECKVCSKKFSTNDLLDEKIHKTSCDHFFHKECLNKAYFIKQSRRYFCEFCEKPMYYGWDAKDWQMTLEKIRQRVQSELQPQQGIKRKSIVAEGPPQKKHKADEGALVRYDSYPEYFPDEIWYKILFSLLIIRKEPQNAQDEIEEMDSQNLEVEEDSQNLEVEEDSQNAQDEIEESKSQNSQEEIKPVEDYKCSEFNDSLKALLNLRIVSKRFFKLFDIPKFSLNLKLFMSQSDINLNKMPNCYDGDFNPFYLACMSGNEYLAKILFMSSENSNQLATFRDEEGMNAFHYAMTNLKPMFCEFIIKHAIVDVGDELSYDWGTGYSVARAVLSETQRNDILSLFEILISYSNENKLIVIEEILYAGFDEKNFAVSTFAIEELLKYPDIMASKEALLRMIDSLLANPDLLVASENKKNLFNVNCKRKITPLGHYFVDNLFPRLVELFNDKFPLLKREQAGINLIHLAILLNSVKTIQLLIIEMAGSQALELLKSRVSVNIIENPNHPNINIRLETTLEMTISLGYHDMAKLLAGIMYKLAVENQDHETVNYILGTYPP